MDSATWNMHGGGRGRRWQLVAVGCGAPCVKRADIMPWAGHKDARADLANFAGIAERGERVYSCS